MTNRYAAIAMKLLTPALIAAAVGAAVGMAMIAGRLA